MLLIHQGVKSDETTMSLATYHYLYENIGKFESVSHITHLRVRQAFSYHYVCNGKDLSLHWLTHRHGYKCGSLTPWWNGRPR